MAARASYAHWKASWLASGKAEPMKRGRDSKSKSRSIPIPRKFRPRSTGARVLPKKRTNPAMARAFYQKLSDRFRNYYYAEFGRQRLKGLPGAARQRRSQPYRKKVR
jgi:hypothetical protein